MAIVREFTARSGARVQIADDCYRDLTPEEVERRRAEVWRVMCQIAAHVEEAEAEKSPSGRREGT